MPNVKYYFVDPVLKSIDCIAEDIALNSCTLRENEEEDMTHQKVTDKQSAEKI